MEKLITKIRKTKQHTGGGSGTWIPFASYCTTGQFAGLQGGYRRHCGPTAAVNVIRTLQNRVDNKARPAAGRASAAAERALFLQCASIGKRTRIYWNTDVLGRFGGTYNFLTGFFLQKCMLAAGCSGNVSVRFHPWISPEAVGQALDRGDMVYLQVYFHPLYKNHHMVCYARETGSDGEQRFLLADGIAPGPVWTDAKGLGRGHFLTITCHDL